METNEILGLLIFVALGLSLILCKCSIAYTRNEKLSAFSWTFLSFSISTFFGIFMIQPLFWFVFIGIVFFISLGFTVFKSYSKKRHRGDRKKHQKFFLYIVLMLCALIVERSLIYATLQSPFVFYILIAINVFLILMALKKSLEHKVKAPEEHYVLMISAMFLIGVLIMVNLHLSFLYSDEAYVLFPCLIICIIAIASFVYQILDLRNLRSENLKAVHYDQKQYLFKEIAYGKRWIVKISISLLLIMAMAYSFF